MQHLDPDGTNAYDADNEYNEYMELSNWMTLQIHIRLGNDGTYDTVMSLLQLVH